jgi:hypothetical protein
MKLQLTPLNIVFGKQHLLMQVSYEFLRYGRIDDEMTTSSTRIIDQMVTDKIFCANV